jgi:hypothetical protein
LPHSRAGRDLLLTNGLNDDMLGRVVTTHHLLPLRLRQEVSMALVCSVRLCISWLLLNPIRENIIKGRSCGHVLHSWRSSDTHSSSSSSSTRLKWARTHSSVDRLKIWRSGEVSDISTAWYHYSPDLHPMLL